MAGVEDAANQATEVSEQLNVAANGLNVHGGEMKELITGFLRKVKTA
jgi:hypothetical protein